MSMSNFPALIHAFGHTTYGQETTRTDLYDYLRKHDIDVDQHTVKDAIEQVIAESFVYVGSPVGTVQRLIFKVDAYYRHLDYIELIEARANTRSANRNSIIALCVASGLAIVQIAIALLQHVKM